MDLSILVVGSVALDDVETQAGRRSRTLGGACTYFSTVASLYDRVSMVGVVGADFPQEHIAFFKARGIDLRLRVPAEQPLVEQIGYRENYAPLHPHVLACVVHRAVPVKEVEKSAGLRVHAMS